MEAFVATAFPVDATFEATCSISPLERSLRDLRVMNISRNDCEKLSSDFLSTIGLDNTSNNVLEDNS